MSGCSLGCCWCCTEASIIQQPSLPGANQPYVCAQHVVGTISWSGGYRTMYFQVRLPLITVHCMCMALVDICLWRLCHRSSALSVPPCTFTVKRQGRQMHRTFTSERQVWKT